MKNKTKKWIIGIDEAGRGPLAGPVSVGVVLVPAGFDWDLIPGVGDSKQVSEKTREAVFKLAQEFQKAGQLNYKVVMVSAKIIDKKGIIFAVNSAIKTAIDTVVSTCDFNNNRTRSRLVGDEIMVKLDGGLRAPAEFVYQETIIKGDSKEKVIGLASIMAKVTRDRYMVKISEKPEFKAYNFAQHKGYGTKLHREALAENGLSTLHRTTYCRNIRIVV